MNQNDDDDKNGTASGSTNNGTDIDLVGGPFAVIESDPGLFHPPSLLFVYQPSTTLQASSRA